MHRIACVLFAALMVLAGGCGKPKFEVEKYATVGPKEERYIPMAPPEKAIPVTVSAMTGGISIEFYIVNANNQDEAEPIIRKQNTKLFLASSINKPDPKRDLKLSNTNGYVIVLVNPSAEKEVSVTVRITEREP